MKKLLLLIGILSLVVPLTLAQDTSSTDAMEELEPWTCPEGFAGQTLSIFNWSTYIAEDTIPNFEELCDVTVNYDIFESNEAMQARIRQGNPGYDIVVPSGSVIQSMVREELLIPLNRDLIPNFANLTVELTNPEYDPDNVYTVPYQWGTIGLGYNTEAFPDGITTWAEVWAHDGAVAWLDDRRSMIGFALKILGFDPNTEDADEISAARDYLIEHGSNVVAIAADDGQTMLERGDVDVTVEYSGDILALIDGCECETYAYVIPAEAANVWVDNLAIPVDAPNPDLASVFIDYILDPQVGADISNYTAYASPNQASIDHELIDPEYLSNLAIYPSEEIKANLFQLVGVSAEAEQLYNTAWDELLIFLGT